MWNVQIHRSFLAFTIGKSHHNVDLSCSTTLVTLHYSIDRNLVLIEDSNAFIKDLSLLSLGYIWVDVILQLHASGNIFQQYELIFNNVARNL